VAQAVPAAGENIFIAQSRPAVGSEVERAVVGMDVRRTFVVGRIDGGAEVLRLFPFPIFAERRLPDVVPALPAGAVADEVKRAPVGRKRRRGFPAPGVDGCPQVMGRAPAIALAAGNVYVATPQAIGAVATGEEEVFPVRRNAVGAFVVQLRIDLPLQEARFLPG